MYARALGFVEMLDVCLIYFCVVVVGYYAIDFYFVVVPVVPYIFFNEEDRYFFVFISTTTRGDRGLYRTRQLVALAIVEDRGSWIAVCGLLFAFFAFVVYGVCVCRAHAARGLRSAFFSRA